MFKCTLLFFPIAPQKASMHFQHEVPQHIPEKRYYMDRYATNRSQYLFRGQPGSNPVCWLGDQWQRHPPEQHNTSRLGASLPWGPEKMGEICCWVRAYGWDFCCKITLSMDWISTWYLICVCNLFTFLGVGVGWGEPLLTVSSVETACTEFDSGDISGLVQSLAHDGRPSIKWPLSIMPHLAFKSGCSHSALLTHQCCWMRAIYTQCLWH